MSRPEAAFLFSHHLHKLVARLKFGLLKMSRISEILASGEPLAFMLLSQVSHHRPRGQEVGGRGPGRELTAHYWRTWHFDPVFPEKQKAGKR